MKYLLFITMLITIGMMNAQTFNTDLPDDFTSITFQGDLFGSIDKEGLNSVISFENVDWKIVESELQVQTIFNNDVVTKGWSLSYLDIQAGVGPMIPLSPRMTITPGIAVGVLFRPKKIFKPEGEGFQSFFIWGPKLKGRLWLGKTKKWGIVISGSYDKRKDNSNWQINGRAGLTRIL
tara:strand:- start:79119 stop:79652 length:534 start_codon:yes stop_codon:yes gene_type:complete